MTAQRTAPPTTPHRTLAPERYAYAPRLNDTRLSRPVPSRSTRGLMYDAPWLDTVTGAHGCPDSCQARHKPAHVHSTDLAALAVRIGVLAALTGRDEGHIVTLLRDQLVRASRLTDGMLAYQIEWLAPREAGNGREAYPLNVVWLAATLVQADRAALAEAATKHTRKAVAA